MYEAHFGLKSRPFGSKAEGSGVFTGPRQAEVITSLKKGLAAHDAVVTVTGPVGVGKTTIVNRSLETISPNRMAAWVGRMQLAPDEVLDLLLAGFGLGGKARGTIQRFALFRRLLTERAAAGAQVAIVVEDAVRIGADALVELEALTAADAGDGAGANIILMGPPDLHKLLARPELARLKQRSRLRQDIPALTLPEVQGYLKHCIREAGGDYDRIFGTGVAEIVHGCAEGIPRLINTLCESALTAAMEDGQTAVPASLTHKIAADTFGYEGPLPEPDPNQDTPAVEPAVPAAPAVESAPATPEDAAADIDREKPDAVDVASIESMDEADLPPAARNIVVESGRYPDITESPNAPEMPEPAETPVANDAVAPTPEEPAPQGLQADPAAPGEDDFAIPELIDDTQPELSKLSVPAEAPEPADPAYEKTGSTAIQKAPPDLEAMAGNEPDDQDNASGNFDLDAALTIDAEDTNIMQAVTPDLDAIARESAGEAANEANPTGAEQPAPDPAPEKNPAQSASDDLPTLSDSMRVDIDAEVDKAKQAMAATAAPEAPAAAAATTPAAKAPPAPAPNTPAAKETPTAAPAAEAPAHEPQPAPEPAAEIPAPGTTPKPPPAAPAPDPDAAPTPRAAAKTPAAQPAARAPDGATIASTATTEKTKTAELAEAPVAPQAPPTGKPAAEDAEPEMLTLEPDLDLLEQNTPGPALDDESAGGEVDKTARPASAAPAAPDESGPAPVAKVSEMTARIAALDPASRSNDVDALEEALAAAKKGELDQMLEAAANPAAPAEAVEEIAADVPEITLDEVLSKQEQQNAELDEFAAEIGKANSLEEFSDKMAETLFGDQDLDEIAAAVVANPPEGYQAKGTLPGDEPEESEETPDLMLELSPEPEAAAPGQAEDAASEAAETDMLTSMNDMQSEAVEMSTGTYEALPADTNGAAPETIENQFNTSMTATLKALSVSKVADEVAEEKQEKKSGGFFSRFRRSS